jgi:amino-acid N-acetyltransferase
VTASRLEAATAEDLERVRAIVERAGLTLAGLADPFPSAFVVVRTGAHLVGCAALERYEGSGLLRSVAVAERQRGRGIGAALVADRLRVARQAGLTDVYLLTATATGYFEHLGFVASARPDGSHRIARSPEFAGACPAFAACLRFVF